jgi:hypothetical protein
MCIGSDEEWKETSRDLTSVLLLFVVYLSKLNNYHASQRTFHRDGTENCRANTV